MAPRLDDPLKALTGLANDYLGMGCTLPPAAGPRYVCPRLRTR